MGPREVTGFPQGHPHYEILGKCGEGGMGVVYRARDSRLNRLAALKFVAVGKAGTASGDMLVRFRREAEAVAALNHPNIATLFELGDWNGVPFLAMELLTGGTLKEKLQPNGLPLAEVIDYARQLGAGLAAAHAEGILHRDVKPGNAMFSARGALKLLDFGLAKAVAGDDVTQTGMTVGTLAYMAPEVLAGTDASVRSDLYSFAAVVYEMASGRTIYGNAARQGRLGAAVMAGDIQPLRSLRPDMPVEVSDAVAKALARNPSDRFGSVEAFVTALEGAGSVAVGDVTRTISMVREGSSGSGKMPAKGRLAVLAALVLLMSATAAYWRFRTWNGGAHAALRPLVVLPFENLASDSSNEALCIGLQETVSGLLARTPELRGRVVVIPASELRRAQVRTITDAQRQFGAELAVTGSVLRTSEVLQITLNLSDTEPVRQTNSRIFSLPESGVSQLQDLLGSELGALLGQGTLGAASAAAGETTSNSAAYALFLEGQGALGAKNPDAAIAALARAVEADTDFAAARVRLAEAYVRKYLVSKDPKWLALADAESSRVSMAVPSSQMLLVQGLIHRATGRSTEAIDLFSKAWKADSGNIEALRLLAEQYVSAGRPSDAEATFVSAIRLKPGYWPLYDSLGNLYDSQHQYKKSEDAFLTGIALAPASEALQTDLGAMYFRSGNWQGAEKAFRKSLEIKPTGVAYSNLATVLFYEGKYLEAARQTEVAAKLQPTDPVIWGNLGDAWWLVDGARAQAVDAFGKAADLAARNLALNPENARLRKGYALYLAKLGRKAESDAEVRRVLRQAPDDGSVQFYAARAAAASGDRDFALECLARAAKLGYDLKEIEREPDFSVLRDSPRYRQIFAGRQ